MTTECYYKSDECSTDTWECVSCNTLYCEEHGHTSMMGTNVECVSCERVRIDEAEEIAEAQQETATRRRIMLLANEWRL